MTEVIDQTFLTELLSEDKQLKSFILSDTDENDLDVNIESFNDFECKSISNDVSQEIIDIKEDPEIPLITIQNTEDDNTQDRISPVKQLSAHVEDNVKPTYTRSVYRYAAKIYGKSEDPHQTKLDQDINAILGSSDPPPGFGYLQSNIYYLTQQRPIPLEPLQVCINFIFCFHRIVVSIIILNK
ncbi:unnamed protein product [Adineta steineri]|uniref:Uncharacterized protein n=1 Tax=Adineta steineri TaxID=433720 RepID=A0A814M8K5_9BILA|nr:unnamed protein product [Adineta steineri]CAF3611593.1 unnamed protein product [Adineta steineri]